MSICSLSTTTTSQPSQTNVCGGLGNGVVENKRTDGIFSGAT